MRRRCPIFPRDVVLVESVSEEAFGDCFVRSMICSLGVTLNGRSYSRQGVSCGKEVLNDLRHAGTGRCVSLEAASALMFSTPGILVIDACIFSWHLIHAALRRRGPMAVAMITLPRRAQIYVALFSNTVVMCSSGAMCGAKRWRWAMYAAISRSLMV